MTIPAPLLPVGQRSRPNDHPLHIALRDQAFLPRLVPEVEWQDNRNDEERVEKAKTSGTVADAESGLANQARDTLSFHCPQDISSAFGLNMSWIEEPLVAEGGNYSVLVPHRGFDGGIVEHITLNNLQLRMIDLKLRWIPYQCGHHVAALQRLRHELPASSAGSSHDQDPFRKIGICCNRGNGPRAVSGAR